MAAMPDIKAKAKRGKLSIGRTPKPSNEPPEPALPPDNDIDTVPPGRHILRRSIAVLITLASVAVAAAAGQNMWRTYVEAPWTRDATVRAYIVTMAPEVSGRIVELGVADNQLVHKGDLLMVIDPTDYKIAVGRGEAVLQQAIFDGQNITREAQRREGLAKFDAVALEQLQLFQSNAAIARAKILQATADLHQARVNLERTRIVAPVDGWVTNLLAQLDDYADIGQSEVSVVDSNSFWVDAYFEENQLASIHEGDAATIKPAADITMKSVCELIVRQESVPVRTEAAVKATTPSSSRAEVARSARTSQRSTSAEISRDHQASSKAAPGSAGAR